MADHLCRVQRQVGRVEQRGGRDVVPEDIVRLHNELHITPEQCLLKEYQDRVRTL